MEKMEGIVMKNIQERAREYADRHKAAEIIGKVYGYERIYNAEMAAYERGATDQKAIDDAGLYKLKERWEKEAQINHDRDIKSIKERAKLASEDYACDDSYSAGFFTGYVEGATKQKAIDEEVRLKKSDDMTKAEYDRETEFADWYLKNGKSTPTFSDAIEWARKQTIDEACNWLGNYLVVEHKILTKAGCESVINELRKAIEK